MTTGDIKGDVRSLDKGSNEGFRVWGCAFARALAVMLAVAALAAPQASLFVELRLSMTMSCTVLRNYLLFLL